MRVRETGNPSSQEEEEKGTVVSNKLIRRLASSIAVSSETRDNMVVKLRRRAEKTRPSLSRQEWARDEWDECY